LLAFGRRQALKPQVNVRLDALADVFGPMLGSRVQVQLELTPELWRAEVDPAQPESALLNASINARDAMPEGGRLTLPALNLAEADELCVAIADTAKGKRRNKRRARAGGTRRGRSSWIRIKPG
jgi:signal transduction histidine kinase